MNHKAGKTISNAFRKFLDTSACKPNKIWVYHTSVVSFSLCNWKSWLHDNSNQIYLASIEGESVVAERFIKTYKNKIYKHMTEVLKNLYISKVDEIDGKYNNTYHRTNQVKPANFVSDMYIEYAVERNGKDLEFKVGDHVRISKYKDIFAKGFTPSWSEKVFMIKKVKHTVLWTYIINDLHNEKLLKNFIKKSCRRPA